MKPSKIFNYLLFFLIGIFFLLVISFVFISIIIILFIKTIYFIIIAKSKSVIEFINKANVIIKLIKVNSDNVLFYDNIKIKNVKNNNNIVILEKGMTVKILDDTSKYSYDAGQLKIIVERTKDNKFILFGSHDKTYCLEDFDLSLINNLKYK